MPLQSFILDLFRSIKWVLFSDEDPIQTRIDASRSAVYDLVRKSRQMRLQPSREALQELARLELQRIELLEKKRLRMVIYAASGLLVGGFLSAWAVLAIVL